MATMTDCLDMLRRRIGDTETPYTFDDTLLTGYMQDAVAEVELDWARGFTVDSGAFNSEPTPQDCVLFTIKAHYLVTLRTKGQADRNNFLMRKGKLTLDNTNQAKDQADTLAILDREYRRMLYRAKNSGGSISGVRME